MRIAIIDGMGGGLGAQIAARVAPALRQGDELLALGTNAIATAAMLKAGATSGATGENAILLNAARADVILGPIGAAIPHSLLGEITPAMACAVALSPARKLLVPTAQSQGHFELAGVESRPLASALDDMARRVRELLAGRPGATPEGAPP
jgi:NAD(P)-dependent dehydrogenase (short-subunit alcohol dehydrogenase family)